MNILIKSAQIICPSSKYHNKKMDVLIENGIIKSIKKNISKTDKGTILKANNLHLSIGWFDMQVNFCDPGFEHKEDIETGIQSAIKGGFTGVAVVSSTNPPIQNKSDIKYIINKTTYSLTDVYPIGSITTNQDGENISEMYDMHLAGAIAFSDDKKVISNAGVLTRALLYTQNFDGLIITHCDEKSISLGGKMNEGVVSTKLGLKGIPALAEELMVSRNIFLSEYTNAPVHIANISTKKSVELIKKAKAKGIKVTASVNSYNIAVNEDVLIEFDSNYKLNPPLRTKTDITALLKGLQDNTIDAITSDHRPHDVESKVLEFDDAQDGMIALETSFSLVNTNKGKLELESIIESITTGPRNILKITQPIFEEGEFANITLFDPSEEWTYNLSDIQSKSKNSPFIGTTFTGKVVGVINNKQSQFN